MSFEELLTNAAPIWGRFLVFDNCAEYGEHSQLKCLHKELFSKRGGNYS